MKVKDLLNYDGCSFAAEINGMPVVGIIAIKDGLTYLCQDKMGLIRPEIKSNGYKHSWGLGASNNGFNLEDVSVTNFKLLLSRDWQAGDILQKDGECDLEIVFCGGNFVVCAMVEHPDVRWTYTHEELRSSGRRLKKSAEEATPPEATPSELELRKWALEMSLNHANRLFPQKKIKRPSEYLSNAHKIIKLVAEDWDKPLSDDCLSFCRVGYSHEGIPEQDWYPTLDSNP